MSASSTAPAVAHALCMCHVAHFGVMTSLCMLGLVLPSLFSACSARVVFNGPVFTLEVWLKAMSLAAPFIPSVVACSSALPDDLSTTSTGYLLVIDPCGQLAVLLGTGRQTSGASSLTPLTAFLTKTCAGYLAEVVAPEFPWLILRAPLLTGQWHHVVVAYSSVLSRLSIVVDAVEVSSVSHASDTIYVPNFQRPLFVGAGPEPELQLLGVHGL